MNEDCTTEEAPLSERLSALAPPPGGFHWCVVHTRPRCEKKLLAVCEERGLFGYCPCLTRTHRYGNRERTTLVPMFSGYMFCVADAGGQQWVRQNRNAARLLPVSDEEVLARQLIAVQVALETEEIVEVLPFLQKGRTVRICSGSMKGVEGVVHDVKGKTRVLLQIEMIQQSVVIDLDSREVVPV